MGRDHGNRWRRTCGGFSMFCWQAGWAVRDGEAAWFLQHRISLGGPGLMAGGPTHSGAHPDLPPKLDLDSGSLSILIPWNPYCLPKPEWCPWGA